MFAQRDFGCTVVTLLACHASTIPPPVGCGCSFLFTPAAHPSPTPRPPLLPFSLLHFASLDLSSPHVTLFTYQHKTSIHVNVLYTTSLPVSCFRYQRCLRPFKPTASQLWSPAWRQRGARRVYMLQRKRNMLYCTCAGSRYECTTWYCRLPALIVLHDVIPRASHFLILSAHTRLGLADVHFYPTDIPRLTVACVRPFRQYRRPTHHKYAISHCRWYTSNSGLDMPHSALVASHALRDNVQLWNFYRCMPSRWYRCLVSSQASPPPPGCGDSLWIMQFARSSLLCSSLIFLPSGAICSYVDPSLVFTLAHVRSSHVASCHLTSPICHPIPFTYIISFRFASHHLAPRHFTQYHRRTSFHSTSRSITL